MRSRSPRPESLGPLSPASQLLMAGTWIVAAPWGPGLAVAPEMSWGPEYRHRRLCSCCSPGAASAPARAHRSRCGAAGIGVQQGSSALCLDRPRPASSAPSRSCAPPSSLYTPALQSCLRGHHVSPSILIGSLFLVCRHVSEATRTLCCCSFRSLPSCPDTRGRVQ